MSQRVAARIVGSASLSLPSLGWGAYHICLIIHTFICTATATTLSLPLRLSVCGRIHDAWRSVIVRGIISQRDGSARPRDARTLFAVVRSLVHSIREPHAKFATRRHNRNREAIHMAAYAYNRRSAVFCTADSHAVCRTL